MVPTKAPYDAIHVGAAAPTVPQALIDQLASPGRMFIPVGVGMQYIEQIDKDAQGNVSRKRVMGVRVSTLLLYCGFTPNLRHSYILLVCPPNGSRSANSELKGKSIR